MDWLAQSMRFFPMSASSMFLTSQFTCVGVVDILCCASPVARCAKLGYESKACLVQTPGAKSLRGRSRRGREGPLFHGPAGSLLLQGVRDWLMLQTRVAGQLFSLIGLLPGELGIV